MRRNRVHADPALTARARMRAILAVIAQPGEHVRDSDGTGRDEAAHWALDGEVTLRESKFDPVADLPVRKVRFIEFAERSSKQYAEIIRTVPGEWIRPYVHQRYDDLSVIGAD